ncbi:MAG TPA: hypothetical protein ENG59_00500 [Chloroflexi bacterium]|nr:hypothetical protein [Chloroflexota bacterium]
MFTINLDSFNMQQKELHRRAAMYRLAKSLREPPRRLEKIYAAVGNALVILGQQLLSRVQTAC